MTPRTVVNVLSNWTGLVAGTAIAFFLSPFVVHSLGDVRYGVWGVVGSIVGYLGLLDMGVRVGVTRFVARYEALGEPDAVNRVLTAALGLFAVAGLLAIVLGFLLALLVPRVVDIPSGVLTESSAAVVIAGITVAVSLVGGVFGGSIAGVQRFAVLNLIDVGVEAARAMAVVLVLRAGGGLVGLSVVQFGAAATRCVLYFVAYWRMAPGLRVSRALWDPAVVKDILRFSGYTMVLHISAVVIFSSDPIIIAALMPVAQVTFFVIAANLTQSALQVLGGVSRVLYPLVSARQAMAGTAATSGLVRDSVRVSSLVILPIVVTFLVRGPTFIDLWMGPAYRGPTGAVLQILAAGLFFYAGYHVFGSNVMALNLHRGLVAPFVSEAVANLGLSLALGYSLGVYGVAWGTTLPRVALALGFAPWFARRKLGIGWGEYAVHVWVRPFVAMIPFGVASAVVDRAWPAAGLVAFFAQVAVVFPLAAAGVWAIGLNASERRRIRDGARAAWAGRRLLPRNQAGRA